MIKEDIQPGYAPEEISFGGYTTKNLHHSGDAAKAFQETIQRAGGKHQGTILTALKATDKYMQLNDMHLNQGKQPDPTEMESWIKAHKDARLALNTIGEFMHHEDYWHMHEHELQDMMSNYTPETAGAEMADSYEPQGDLVEELTDKTIRSGDKIKVARVIADMLGVENAESMSPDVAINTGLRKIKNKRMTPEMVGILKKMLGLAQEVGVKVDMTLVPKSVNEAKITDILRFNDYAKLSKLNKGIVPMEGNNDPEDEMEVGKDGDESPEQEKPAAQADAADTVQNIPTQVGSSMQHPADDQMRRRKVQYKTEETDVKDAHFAKQSTKMQDAINLHLRKGKSYWDAVTAAKKHVKEETDLDEDMHSADYKVNPQTGRKYRAHHIEFKNSKMNAEPADDEKESKDKEAVIITKPLLKKTRVQEEAEDQAPEFNEDDLEKMADEVDEPEDVLDVYDGEELEVVDQETGEVVEDEDEPVNEEALNEVMSRMQRMRARVRFLQTKTKRARRLQLALKTRSSTAKINKRARTLAIKLIKQRILKKPASQFTVLEKERVERMLEKRKAVIDRLAMKLVPRIRKIENARLSHSKFTQPAAPSAA